MRHLSLSFSQVFIGSVFASLFLTACASSIPSNFQYETSVRGEQGFIGQSDKIESMKSILGGGVVTDPALALSVALPDEDVKVRAWGLRYFSANWARYKVVMDADIRRDGDKIKCRERSTETPVGAPTLEDLTANDGAELQRQLNALVASCTAKVQ